MQRWRKGRKGEVGNSARKSCANEEVNEVEPRGSVWPRPVKSAVGFTSSQLAFLFFRLRGHRQFQSNSWRGSQCFQENRRDQFQVNSVELCSCRPPDRGNTVPFSWTYFAERSRHISCKHRFAQSRKVLARKRERRKSRMIQQTSQARRKRIDLQVKSVPNQVTNAAFRCDEDQRR